MKPDRRMSRRESLLWLGVGATILAAGSLTGCQAQTEQPKPASAQAQPQESPQAIGDKAALQAVEAVRAIKGTEARK